MTSRSRTSLRREAARVEMATQKPMGGGRSPPPGQTGRREGAHPVHSARGPEEERSPGEHRARRRVNSMRPVTDSGEVPGPEVGRSAPRVHHRGRVRCRRLRNASAIGQATQGATRDPWSNGKRAAGVERRYGFDRRERL
jgi:hypothetical protein